MQKASFLAWLRPNSRRSDADAGLKPLRADRDDGPRRVSLGEAEQPRRGFKLFFSSSFILFLYIFIRLKEKF